MPSTRDIRRRIKSIKNTSQITKAMQMVAASKMRRAQQAALAGRPYAELMNNVLSELSANSGGFSNPLLEKREGGKRCILLISSDKGLCGALNSNLLREAAKEADKGDTLFVTAGRKGSQFIGRTKRELAGDFEYADSPAFAEARAMSKFVQDLFLEEKVSRVDVMYTNFVNTLVQKPEVQPLLPVGEIKGVTAGVEGAESGQELAESTNEFLFEPDPEKVLGDLLPHYLNFQVYQILLEAKASEHSSRMVAMKSATDNAKSLIKDLTLEYNKLRQAAITSELLEITTASMAMG